MNLLKKFFVIGVSILLSAFALFGAEIVDLRQAGDAYLQQFDNTAINTNNAQALSFSENSQLQELYRVEGENGVSHTRSVQLYNGIPVFGEHIIISRDTNGRVVQLHGRITQSIENDITAFETHFTKDEALQMMKSQNTYYSQSSEQQYSNESSELFVYVDKSGVARLVYAVSYFVDTPEGGNPSRPYFIIDAQTGEVLEQWEGLTHQKVGTGPGGNARIGQYEYGTDYGFMDVEVNGSTYTMRNANVKTINLNHGTSGTIPYSYQGPRNTVKSINGAYSPLNDAHYFGGVVYEMFQAYVGVAPLTFQLTMRVHYSTNYQNAFWNGSSMTFGDGGTTFHPLVSLGVVAHEVSHGFTEQNSRLIYSNQSGGINESFSDMAGEAAEFFMKGSCDFMIGSDIKKISGAMRYMDDPTKDGRSIGHVSAYTPGMDVHFSSGVYNKVYYLLATKPGWDAKKAFILFAKANRSYWTPSTTFQSGAVDVYDAAVELGYNTADVVAAFKGVGIEIGNVVGTLSDALDNSTLTFTGSGNKAFFPQATTSYFDGDAAQAGQIDNNQTSSLTTTVQGPATLSYYWKVSSEANYDFLTISVDGVEQAKISGEVNWTQKSLQIVSGSHTVTWSYVKDGATVSGSDTGWVDKVEVTTGGGNLAPTVTLQADKTSYTKGDTITITADAKDTDGQVVKVEFFKDSLSHSTDTAAPYQISIPNAQPGTYTFYAIATDDKNATGQSPVITVKVTDIVTGNDWQPGVTYAVGDVVVYQGANWICTFAHQSNAAWYPGAPGIWFWKKQ